MSEHMRSRREFLRDAGATALVVGAVGTAGAVAEADRPAEASAPALPAGFVPIDPSIFDPSHWPIPHFPSVDDIETYLANKLGIKGWLPSPPDKDPADVTIHTNDPLTITLPGLTGFKLILGQAGMDYSCTIFRSEQAIQINNLPVRLELDPSIFKPMKKVGSDYVDDTAPGAVVHADFTIAMIKVGLDGSIHFPGAPPTFSLSPAQIGSSGLVIEASGIQAKLGADTTPATDRGLHIASAVVAFKPLAGMVFTATDVHIGNNGFSGTLSTTFASLSITLLGFGIKLTKFEAIFKQSSLLSTDIVGQLTIPFFDAPLDVDIGFNLSGDVSITAKGAGPDGATHLTVPGLFDLKLTSFKFVEKAGGKSKMQLDLKLKPIFTVPVINLTLPEFDLGGLILDQDGNVDPEFGVIDQKNAKHFTVAGFDFECDRLGLGIDLLGGKLYLVFKGGITFPAGLPVGVSVDGLKVLFEIGSPHNIGFELGGIGIDTTIAGVVAFKGDVHLGNNGFSGDLDLTIIPLKLRIQASLAVQSSPFSAWYIDLKVDLPAGIPLGPSGLAIYGFEGLFAYNFAPNRDPGENWYRGTPADFNNKALGWYSKAPHNNVRDPNTKWKAEEGHFAFGIGATLGTAVDDGQAVAVQVLIIIAVPGPVIIIEGAANILSGRDDLDNADFMALLVIDAENDIFELGIDIDLKLPKPDGPIVEISGSVDAYFDGHHPDRWHLYIGQQPRPLRLGASILQLFHADTYFMLTNDNLRFGAWIGYDASWDFGPVSAAISAYIEGDTLVSWRPPQVAGTIHLHGGLSISIFGIGFSLSADAIFGVNVPNPFAVVASVSIHLGLPWPLPDIDASITLSWEHGQHPDAVDPLERVALQHPLTVANLVAGNSTGDAPVVPVDWRPIISFSHDLNNAILPATLPIQGPLGPANPCEQASPANMPVPNLTIPETAWHYTLTGLSLEEAPAGGGAFSPYSPIWASWLFVQGRTDAVPGTRLLSFYTANPYQYDINSSDSSLLGWFNNAYSGYPCDTRPNRDQYQQYCVDLRTKDPRVCLTEPLGIGGFGFLPLTTICRDLRGVSYTDPLQITLPAPSSAASVRAQGDTAPNLQAAGLGSGFTLLGRYRGKPAGSPVHATLSGGSWYARITAPLIDEMVVIPDYRGIEPKLAQELETRGRHPGLAALQALRRTFATSGTRVPPAPLVQVCVAEASRVASLKYEADQYAFLLGQTVTDKKHWASQANVFNPNKLYRLTVNTKAAWFLDVANCAANKAPDYTMDFPHTFYFKTGDGPQETNALVPYIEQRQPKPDADPPVLPKVMPDGSGWTIPANGALTHFRSYDLGVRFRVNWVNAMYTGGHRPLTFELLDLNGKPATDTHGNPLKDLFVDSPEHLITTEENAWFTHLKGSCQPIDPSTIHVDSVYTITGNGPNPLDLVPSMFYRVQLREQGNPNVLYQFSFATSNFHTFAEMVKSFNSSPVPGKPWRPPAAKLSVPQFAGLKAKVLAVSGASRDAESKTFDDVAALFNYPARKWPPRTEVTLFSRLLPSNVVRGVALLIEMPQPLDWERTGIQLLRRFTIPGYLPISSTHVRSFDDTRIFLFIPSVGPLSKGQYGIHFTYKRDLGVGTPVYSVGGDSSDEVASIFFKI